MPRRDVEELSRALDEATGEYRIHAQVLGPRAAFPASWRAEEIPLDAAIATALAALEGGATAASQGRGSMLPSRVEKQPLDLVARDFGEDFAKALEGAPVGQWTGPVRSGFGLHLVRVNTRTPAYVPGLDEARKAVTREWENERRQAALADNYARLLGEYDVVIEAAGTEATAR